METYTLVSIEFLDLENGEKINNLINSNQINYSINKIKNKYTHDWIIHNPNININEIIYNNLATTLIIITKEDFNSLLGLLYSDNKNLLNYNDMYNIITLEGYFEFESNSNLNNTIKKKIISHYETLKTRK